MKMRTSVTRFRSRLAVPAASTRGCSGRRRASAHACARAGADAGACTASARAAAADPEPGEPPPQLRSVPPPEPEREPEPEDAGAPGSSSACRSTARSRASGTSGSSKRLAQAAERRGSRARRRARLSSPGAASICERRRPALRGLRSRRARIVRRAHLRGGLNPALAQREVALAGVALLAAVVALVVTSPHGTNSGGHLSPVVVPGGGWYTALAGAQPVRYGTRTNCWVMLRPTTRGSSTPCFPATSGCSSHSATARAS